MTTTISGTNGIDKVAPGAVERGDLPAGTVLQVVSTTKTDTFTSSSATYTTVTGLSVSITPTSATSKILIIVSVNGSQTVGTNDAYFGIFRNSTQIAMGDAAGSRIQISGMLNSGNSGWQVNSGMNFLDSPSTTTSTTYAVQVRTANGSNLYINRGLTDSDAASGAGRAASTITAMEIAQ